MYSCNKYQWCSHVYINIEFSSTLYHCKNTLNELLSNILIYSNILISTYNSYYEDIKEAATTTKIGHINA